MEWNEAIEKAKRKLGYCSNEYVEDWNSVVERAKDIIIEENEEEYSEFCDNAKEEYKEYLKSDRWKELRLLRLEKDNFKCRDCGNEANEVHHTSYNNINTPWEIHEIISLCHNCHERRHNKNVK